MNDTKKTSPDILEVIDNALTAALREVRRARAKTPVNFRSTGPDARQRTSNVNLCMDILGEAGGPLHITVLLDAILKLGIKTSRDSLASALSKRLAPRGPFIRTEPNTFGLAVRDRPREG
jgi:HB1, ASXL, restriction endonuclease HTH domain